MMKLEEFAEINMGQSPVSSSYNENEDGLPFFQGKADFGKINPKAKVWCNKPTKIAEKDDILMSVRAPVGDLNIATAKCCIGRGLAGITAKKDKCYFKYLFYFLRSKYNELNNTLDEKIYEDIINYAYDLGIRNCFVQEQDSKGKCFIPDFTQKIES